MRVNSRKMKNMWKIRLGMLLIGISSIVTLRSAEPLIVHEWGTFTVLQDWVGNSIDGVNINEESLPGFVHRLSPHLAPDSHEFGLLLGLGQFRPQGSKGIARYYHAARMRMETPIVYLYPPNDQPRQPMQVKVNFKGGWVTEWYPKATVTSPGFIESVNLVMSQLKPTTVGSILWNDVRVNPNVEVPVTESPVWLAPRETAAPSLEVPNGEAERYLFYRGVANLEAPIRVIRNGDKLNLYPNESSTCPVEDFDEMDLWLVNVAEDLKLSYRKLRIKQAFFKEGGKLTSTNARLKKGKESGYVHLRKEMISSLVDSGLFHDEAKAMLNTWQVSYFQTPGLRVFFTLPQQWTDNVLPMEVSGYENVEYKRSMIGRIELISDVQNDHLQALSKGSISNRAWFDKWYSQQESPNEKLKELFEGKATLVDLGLNPPTDYRHFIKLGRFREAIVRHQIKNPIQSSKSSGNVAVKGTEISINNSLDKSKRITSIKISLPGEKRIINLAELGIFYQGRNIVENAKLTQSSNYQNRFPIENLVDGKKDVISHTNEETNPWIRVEFTNPVQFDEIKIWNRPGSEYRFANAKLTFYAQGHELGAVSIEGLDSRNLQTFARNYRLPL